MSLKKEGLINYFPKKRFSFISKLNETDFICFPRLKNIYKNSLKENLTKQIIMIISIFEKLRIKKLIEIYQYQSFQSLNTIVRFEKSFVYEKKEKNAILKRKAIYSSKNFQWFFSQIIYPDFKFYNFLIFISQENLFENGNKNCKKMIFQLVNFFLLEKPKKLTYFFLVLSIKNNLASMNFFLSAMMELNKKKEVRIIEYIIYSTFCINIFGSKSIIPIRNENYKKLILINICRLIGDKFLKIGFPFKNIMNSAFFSFFCENIGISSSLIKQLHFRINFLLFDGEKMMNNFLLENKADEKEHIFKIGSFIRTRKNLKEYNEISSYWGESFFYRCRLIAIVENESIRNYNFKAYFLKIRIKDELEYQIKKNLLCEKHLIRAYLYHLLSKNSIIHERKNLFGKIVFLVEFWGLKRKRSYNFQKFQKLLKIGTSLKNINVENWFYHISTIQKYCYRIKNHNSISQVSEEKLGELVQETNSRCRVHNSNFINKWNQLNFFTLKRRKINFQRQDILKIQGRIYQHHNFCKQLKIFLIENSLLFKNQKSPCLEDLSLPLCSPKNIHEHFIFKEKTGEKYETLKTKKIVFLSFFRPEEINNLFYQLKRSQNKNKLVFDSETSILGVCYECINYWLGKKNESILQKKISRKLKMMHMMNMVPKFLEKKKNIQLMTYWRGREKKKTISILEIPEENLFIDFDYLKLMASYHKNNYMMLEIKKKSNSVCLEKLIKFENYYFGNFLKRKPNNIYYELNKIKTPEKEMGEKFIFELFYQTCRFKILDLKKNRGRIFLCLVKNKTITSQMRIKKSPISSVTRRLVLNYSLINFISVKIMKILFSLLQPIFQKKHIPERISADSINKNKKTKKSSHSIEILNLLNKTNPSEQRLLKKLKENKGKNKQKKITQSSILKKCSTLYKNVFFLKTIILFNSFHEQTKKQKNFFLSIPLMKLEIVSKISKLRIIFWQVVRTGLLLKNPNHYFSNSNYFKLFFRTKKGDLIVLKYFLFFIIFAFLRPYISKSSLLEISNKIQAIFYFTYCIHPRLKENVEIMQQTIRLFFLGVWLKNFPSIFPLNNISNPNSTIKYCSNLNLENIVIFYSFSQYFKLKLKFPALSIYEPSRFINQAVIPKKKTFSIPNYLNLVLFSKSNFENKREKFYIVCNNQYNYDLVQRYKTVKKNTRIKIKGQLKFLKTKKDPVEIMLYFLDLTVRQKNYKLYSYKQRKVAPKNRELYNPLSFYKIGSKLTCHSIPNEIAVSIRFRCENFSYFFRKKQYFFKHGQKRKECRVNSRKNVSWGIDNQTKSFFSPPFYNNPSPSIFKKKNKQSRSIFGSNTKNHATAFLKTRIYFISFLDRFEMETSEILSIGPNFDQFSLFLFFGFRIIRKSIAKLFSILFSTINYSNFSKFKEFFDSFRNFFRNLISMPDLKETEFKPIIKKICFNTFIIPIAEPLDNNICKKKNLGNFYLPVSLSQKELTNHIFILVFRTIFNLTIYENKRDEFKKKISICKYYDQNLINDLDFFNNLSIEVLSHFKILLNFFKRNLPNIFWWNRIITNKNLGIITNKSGKFIFQVPSCIIINWFSFGKKKISSFAKKFSENLEKVPDVLIFANIWCFLKLSKLFKQTFHSELSRKKIFLQDSFLIQLLVFRSTRKILGPKIFVGEKDTFSKPGCFSKLLKDITYLFILNSGNSFLGNTIKTGRFSKKSFQPPKKVFSGAQKLKNSHKIANCSIKGIEIDILKEISDVFCFFQNCNSFPNHIGTSFSVRIISKIKLLWFTSEWFKIFLNRNFWLVIFYGLSNPENLIGRHIDNNFPEPATSTNFAGYENLNPTKFLEYFFSRSLKIYEKTIINQNLTEESFLRYYLRKITKKDLFYKIHILFNKRSREKIFLETGLEGGNRLNKVLYKKEKNILISTLREDIYILIDLILLNRIKKSNHLYSFFLHFSRPKIYILLKRKNALISILWFRSMLNLISKHKGC